VGFLASPETEFFNRIGHKQMLTSALEIPLTRSNICEYRVEMAYEYVISKIDSLGLNAVPADCHQLTNTLHA
jgi:hypothetical protein